MNNKKIFERIITEKRAKSSNERPKYGLRKLTVGVVSCLLGYMMFMTPNVTLAEKVEAAPQAKLEAKVESTKANPAEVVEQPKEEAVVSKELTKPKETKATDVANTASVAKKSAVQPKSATTTETTAETTEKSTEFKLTDKQKKKLEEAGFNAEQIQKIEKDIRLELEKDSNYDVEKHISDAIEKADQPELVLSPKETPTGVRAAAGDEDTTVGKDAKDAVHGYVGVQVGGDLNLKLNGATGQQFKPVEGVKVYFQWFEKWSNGKEYTSPVYSTTSDASGQFHMGIKPYLAPDG